jgi:DNA-binding CsgD family transcriptional regulator
VRRRLRELGVRGIARGPRGATRRNPPLLTAREPDVLALLGEGLRAAEIADRLRIRPKTVDHHMSAILRKLGVHSCRDAVVEAPARGGGDKIGTFPLKDGQTSRGAQGWWASTVVAR